MSLIAAALLMLASGTTTGQQTNPPVAAKPQQDTKENDPMVCESSQELGSRIKRKKVCMRRSEWERQRQENKQMIDRSQVQRGLDPVG